MEQYQAYSRQNSGQVASSIIAFEEVTQLVLKIEHTVIVVVIVNALNKDFIVV